MLPYSYEVGAFRVIGSGQALEARDDEFGFDPELTARIQGTVNRLRSRRRTIFF
jgi:hypothetical protein